MGAEWRTEAGGIQSGKYLHHYSHVTQSQTLLLLVIFGLFALQSERGRLRKYWALMRNAFVCVAAAAAAAVFRRKI